MIPVSSFAPAWSTPSSSPLRLNDGFYPAWSPVLWMCMSQVWPAPLTSLSVRGQHLLCSCKTLLDTKSKVNRALKPVKSPPSQDVKVHHIYSHFLALHKTWLQDENISLNISWLTHLCNSRTELSLVLGPLFHIFIWGTFTSDHPVLLCIISNQSDHVILKEKLKSLKGWVIF